MATVLLTNVLQVTKGCGLPAFELGKHSCLHVVLSESAGQRLEVTAMLHARGCPARKAIDPHTRQSRWRLIRAA